MPPSSQPIALVTGASRGIGRAIALQLALDGYAIAINYLSASSHAQSLLAEIQSLGGNAHLHRADISQPKERDNLIQGIQQHFGRLDFLINNAGVAPLERQPLLNATEESYDRLLNINLKGPHFLTQIAANWMIQLQTAGTIPKARICFITSISAYTLSTNRADYCISKAALSMSASLWAAELAQHNIPVLEIRPGIIATDMTTAVKEKYDQLISEGVFPQKRWGTPQDVAAVVSAIGRGNFDYSTGIAIDVSGGFQLKRL